jgi:glycosyltransferase involved in cell wall biosynthesis
LRDRDLSTVAEQRRLSVVQVLPALEMGGVERGTLEVARRLVQEGHRSIVISAGGRLVEQLQAEGSTHLAWDVGAKRIATLRWIPKLRHFLREQRPDILHLRSRLPAWIAYRAWKGLPPAERPALVTTVHGFYTPGWYSSVMMRGERIIAISEAVRAHVLQHYPWVEATRIRVIHRGVDPAVFPHAYTPPAEWLQAWCAQRPHIQGKYILTLPARLSRWKGQEDFIAIIAALRQKGLPVHGLLVGGTHPRKRHYETELRAQIEAQGLSDSITLLGHRGDLREIMAMSDVVLSLSRDPEAFGRVSLEALSLGKPVVAYDHGGVGEQLAVILPEGRVPVGDRGRVVERLQAWYRTPPQVPAQHPFTLERMLTATLEVYRDAVAARGGADIS